MNEGTPIIIKKKKGHGGHGHHGGSWKVAYADFVTAMMAFFMVMWIMGLSDSTRATVAGYFNDPMGFMKAMPRSNNTLGIKQGPPSFRKAKAKRSQLEDKIAHADKTKLKKLKKNLQLLLAESGVGAKSLDMKELSNQVEVKLTPEGLQIEFVDRVGAVFFESGSAVVRPEAKEIVMKVGKAIARSGHSIRIQGHTDAQPFGDGSYDNWDLSNDRANAMRHLLMKGGVTDEQLMRVENYADHDLKRKDQPFHFSNRRVTILLPYESTDPDGVKPGDEMKINNQAEFDKSMLEPEPPSIRPTKLKPDEAAWVDDRNAKIGEEAAALKAKSHPPADTSKKLELPDGGEDFKGLTRY